MDCDETGQHTFDQILFSEDLQVGLVTTHLIRVESNQRARMTFSWAAGWWSSQDMQEGSAGPGTDQATQDQASQDQGRDQGTPRQALSPLPSNITASDFSINSNLMKVIIIYKFISIILVILTISNLMKEANDDTNPGTVAYPSLPNSPEVHLSWASYDDAMLLWACDDGATMKITLLFWKRCMTACREASKASSLSWTVGQVKVFTN